MYIQCVQRCNELIIIKSMKATIDTVACMQLFLKLRPDQAASFIASYKAIAA